MNSLVNHPCLSGLHPSRIIYVSTSILFAPTTSSTPALCIRRRGLLQDTPRTPTTTVLERKRSIAREATGHTHAVAYYCTCTCTIDHCQHQHARSRVCRGGAVRASQLRDLGSDAAGVLCRRTLLTSLNRGDRLVTEEVKSKPFNLQRANQTLSGWLVVGCV